MFFKLVISIIISVSLILTSGINNNDKKPANPNVITTSLSEKKVVLIVIDSLMESPMKNAIESGHAPALKFFIKNSNYYPKLISSYPTMSVTIDSSLITGTYANQHKVPGLIWYNNSENRLISYGNNALENIKLGIPNFISDSLYKLNNADLSHEELTIYEQLDKVGLTSASINGLVYRGNYEHTLKLPRLLYKFPSIPKEFRTTGPPLLSFGQLIKVNPTNYSLLNNYGISDRGSREELNYLIQQNLTPNFSLVYFPGNDRPIHNKGIHTVDGIIKVDKELQKILNNFSSWEDALHEITWVIIGDSSQSSILEDKQRALIDLRSLLKDFIIANLEGIKKDDEIILAPNERMAYIYALKQVVSITSIREKLMNDNRIGFVAWKEDETIHVMTPTKTTVLTFKKKGKYTDEFEQSWHLHGDMTILDLSVNNEGRIQYGDYPDGLARLYGALNSHDGRFLIVDAKPGFEFIGESSPTHIGGGAHGSLHAVDSLAPIIIAGTEQVPDHYRIIDLQKWLLKLIRGK
ncbi:alkaline phosphatase family protein [Bacillus suaedaesalsae]|uniref:Alkaline phosphatase family protein n=1 Tax=Bacillus suaedaesalsae TaxID=2810349 RepID=A0ABS2DLE6_9BACI|nr:alkaline phosphatase family protein [Bacillus suaedaesalsae]MBM6619304.1 alkaline phosphatase family protein [Bacillus suaedaesalsae]